MKLKGNDLVLGIGGAAIGAGLTYFMVGKTRVPSDIADAVAGLTASRVTSTGEQALDLKPVLQFSHLNGVDGVMFAWVANSAGDKDNPEAVMSVYVTTTQYLGGETKTANLELGQQAGSDVIIRWHNTVLATLSGLTRSYTFTIS